jgi:hypothetical protein
LEGDFNLRLLSSFDSQGNVEEKLMGAADAAEKQIISIELEAKKVYMLEAYK